MSRWPGGVSTSHACSDKPPQHTLVLVWFWRSGVQTQFRCTNVTLSLGPEVPVEAPGVESLSIAPLAVSGEQWSICECFSAPITVTMSTQLSSNFPLPLSYKDTCDYLWDPPRYPRIPSQPQDREFNHGCKSALSREGPLRGPRVATWIPVGGVMQPVVDGR